MGSPELPLPKRSKEHIKHAIANSARMRNLTFRAKENFSAKENFLTEGFAYFRAKLEAKLEVENDIPFGF
jgi:hypothetical protein